MTWAWKYIYNFKVQVVIWEILRACYYRRTIFADLVRFFNQDTAFYTVSARQSHDLCLNGFLSQAVGLFYLR